jgi:hypothetical protein
MVNQPDWARGPLPEIQEVALKSRRWLIISNWIGALLATCAKHYKKHSEHAYKTFQFVPPFKNEIHNQDSQVIYKARRDFTEL